MAQVAMTDLDKIRAREFDPAMEAHAQAVADQIRSRIQPQRVQLYGSMAAATADPVAKVELLRSVAGELSDAARQLVPCSRGCSHCCHMATLVAEGVALVIAAATGAALAVPAAYLGRDELVDRYSGVACPFLQNGACGIYAQRPFACRTHLHLDRDNTLCQIVPGESVRVPLLDTRDFNGHYVRAFGEPDTARYADIRDFFPQGLGT